MAKGFDLSDVEIANIIQGVYDGDITEYDLPESLYYAIADYLKKGLYEGWGASLNDLKLGTPDYELLAELRENVYMFSGAKSFAQVKDLGSALIDDDGILRTFGEFKKEALDIFDLYGTTPTPGGYLEAEFNTAVGQGIIAQQWNKIEQQKELLPYLRYVAEADDLTCDICAPLDGVTLSVDDDFWDTFTPENHFNCRCTLEQLEEDADDMTLTEDDERDDIAESVGKNMDDMFKMNPGKDGYVFKEGPDGHPYFDVAAKDREFAENNFGLPIPETD